MLLRRLRSVGRSAGWAVLLMATAAGAQSMLIPAEPPNLGKLQIELEQYHDCKGNHGCYATDLNRETGAAIAALDGITRHRHGEKLALILDIDETALSNYAEIRQADFAYDPAVWDRWVERAAAPAIPGTLRLYREARRLGVAVFFITGRPDQQRGATEANLRAQGYTQWAGLTLRSPAEEHTPTVAYKSGARRKIAAAGYRIAVNVGDQMSDLQGSPEADISVKLADPFYFIP